MSRVFIDCPPQGARVRHTTTYVDGPTITIEGHAFDIAYAGRDEPYILIGDEAHHWCSYLVGRPGAYTVAMQVLEVPLLLPQPPLGSVVKAILPGTAEVSHLLHRRSAHWWTSLVTGLDYKWEEICARGVPVLLVADPAAAAPELPATFLGYNGTRDLKVKLERRTASGHDDRILLYVSEAAGLANHQALTPDVAEQVAGALLRAAREARQP